jgi:hypothetical protein
MSLVPERNVWAIFTTASSATDPHWSIKECSRANPLVALVSRSVAVSLSSSPRS